MRRKQVTAILLSAIMTVSACVPMSGIGAFAAENAGAGSTEMVSAAEEPDGESSFAAAGETEAAAAKEAEAAAASETEEDLSVSAEEASDAQETAEQQEDETEAEAQGKTAFEASDETASEENASDDVDETVSEASDEAADTVADTASEAASEAAEEAVEEPTEEKAAGGTADGTTEDSSAQVIEEEAKEEADKTALQDKEPEPSDFEDAEEIFPGDSKNVYYNMGFNCEDFPRSIWKFTPDESGIYRFYAIADGLSTSPVIYDSDYNRLPYYGSSEDDYDFVLEHFFHKGTTYYLTASVDNYYGGADFTVYLEQMEMPDFYVEEDDDAYDIYVDHGEEVTLSPYAHSSTGELYYKWKDYATEELLGTSDSYTFKAERNRRISLTVTDSTDEELANYAYRMFSVHIINHLSVKAEGAERENSTAEVYTLGEPVTLRAIISADDESELRITWEGYVERIDEWGDSYKDLVTIEGANGRELAVEDVKDGDEYYCFVSDQYGNTGEACFRIHIGNLIYAYPEGAANEEQSTAYITADVGSPLTLRPVVKAVDESQLEYEWSRQNEDGEYIAIEGANSAEYRMDQPEQGEYECHITDLFGGYRSVYFSVEVDNQLIAYPEGKSEYSRYAQLTVSPLSSPVLHVLVKAIDESRITYKWQRIIDYDEYEDIEGANGAEYQPILGRGNSYRCVVSDQYGNSEKVEFYLYIDNKLSVHPEGEYDNRNHANVYTGYGESATLRVNVQAIDDSHLTYKWYGDGETVYETDGPELVVQNVTKTQSYRCVVDDSYGYGKDCYFTINIENHLKVYAEGYGKRTSVFIKTSPHTPLTLKVVAEADDTSQMTYKWGSRDDRPVDGDTDTYTISSVEYGGGYYCTVTDRYENSETVYFTVRVDNQFVVYPEGAEEGGDTVDLYVGYGQPLTLRVVANALEEDKITYEWRNESSWEYISDADGNEVQISSVTRPVTYTCYVNDGFGNGGYLYFYIHVENHLTVYPEGYEGRDTAYLYVKPGTEVTMHTVAGADDKEGLRYYWHREDTWEDIDPHNEDTLTVDAKDAEYVCGVTDKYDNYKRIKFVLRVENGFTAYPEGAAMDENGRYRYFVNLYPKAGEQLDLSVNAASDQGALSYKWYENAVYETSWGEYETDYEPMAEAGNTAAIRVTAEKNTSYCCTVSDEYGNEQDVEFYIHMGGAGFVAYPEGNEDTLDNRIAITAEQGKEMTLRVLTSGEEDAEYTYKWSEGPLNDSGWWPLAEGVDGTKDSLTVTPETSRRYLCVVTDQYGNQGMAYFYVNLNGMTITTNHGTPHLVGDNKYEIYVKAKAGDSVTLKTTAETEQTAELSYSWEYCEPRYGAEVLPGEYEDSITVKAGDSKYYVHSIEDGTGNRVTVWYYLDIDNQFSVYPEEGAESDLVDVVTKVGEKITLAPAVHAADMKGMAYEWSDSNGRTLGRAADLVLSVAREDVISCKVTDRFGNNGTVRYYVTFTEKPSIVDISQADITIGDVTYNGKAQLPRIGIYGGGRTLIEGTDYAVTCGQNINAGTYQITISGIGNLTGSVNREYKILKADQTIAASDITLRPYETAKVTVSGAQGSVSYSSGATGVATVAKDGTVTAVKAGTASITVSAAETDNYKAATTQLAVTVNAYDLSSAECKVTLSQTTAVYNGKEIKPTATVKFGDVTLKEGTDYTVSYDNNVNAGSGSVTIVGNDKTTANSAKAAFTITKAPQVISSDAPADGLKIKIGESAKITVSGAQGDVTFASGDTAVATVAADGASDAGAGGSRAAGAAVTATVSAVKEGSTKITVNAAETDNYEAAKALEIVVKVVPATIDVSELQITVDDSGLVYDGKAKTPKVTVKNDGAVLTEGFTVSYQNNVNAGIDTAKAIVTGDNSTLSGTKEVTFTILPGKTTRGDMFNLANNVKVTWQAVPGAKYYKVYRTGVTSASESRKEPVIVTAGLVGWDKDPGLTNGHAYRYTIVASLTGKGDASGDSPKSYSKLMYRLKTVVIRSAKNTAPGKVTVKYDKTTSGDSYVLQYCERQDMVGAKTKVVLGANNTSYVIGGLKKGKTYYISIRVRKKVNGIDYYTTFGVPKKVKIEK